MKKTRQLCALSRTLLTSLGGAVLSLSVQAQTHSSNATSFPSKPLRIVVPFAPGGPNDLMARVVGARLSVNVGQPVVIENKAGAGGVIGTDAVAKAAPDGYTMVFASAPYTMSPAVQARMPYDARKDLQAVTKIAESPMVLMVPSSSRFSDAGKLIEFARQNPEKVSYGSGGAGSTPHLTTEWLGILTGARFLHVPYKGGGESLRALMAGEVDMLIDSVTSTAGALASGRVKAIAVAQARRAPKLPNVPTFEESGVRKFEMTHWVGVLIPKGVPSEVAAKLNQELVKALHSPDVEAKLTEMGAQAVGDPAPEFQRFVLDEIGKWETLVKSRGIKAD